MRTPTTPRAMHPMKSRKATALDARPPASATTSTYRPLTTMSLPNAIAENQANDG
jgi:hypothetical protein